MAEAHPARRGPTLATIAELTGYHVSTVSRVLNGSSVEGLRAASPTAAERIRDVARELGYRPHAAATALRRQRSSLLGVVMSRMADTVLATIYEGIEHAAREHGFQSMVANSWDEASSREACIEMLVDHGVEAVIIGDAPFDGSGLELLEARGIPSILVNRPAEGRTSVTCDDREGGRLAAEHLLELGHRDVGVLAGREHAGNARARVAGFTEAFAAAGHPVPDARVLPSTFDLAGGRTAMERLLDAGPPPTAVFAVSDSTAIGAMGAMRDHGLEPGADLSVVGFNDLPVAAELTIPLTTVRSPLHAMGEQSVHQLVRLIAGSPVASVRLSPELLARATTAPPRAG